MSNANALETAVGILNQIINDSAVPRNIKGTCKDAVERLKNGNNAPHIRAGSVACILDELSQDPNLPFHTRAQIWEVASVLETVTTSSKVK